MSRSLDAPVAAAADAGISWPGLGAFVLPAMVYLFSASPQPGSWDTAELQGVPYILGIAHPTGFPLYVLAGYAWSHVFALGSVAFRMNVFSGFAIATACAAAYAAACEFGANRWVALLASLWFAVTQNAWAHAARAEAQDLAFACSALAIVAFLRWMRTHVAGWFGAAFALAGLAMAAHPNALWILPGLIVGAAIAPRRPAPRVAAASLGLLALGLALYLYLPLRSAYVAAHGLDPTAGLAGLDGGIFWNYNAPRTLHGLVTELTGVQFDTPRYFAAAFNPLHIGDALWAFIGGIHAQYGTLALLVLAAGASGAWNRNWRATFVLCLACTLGLVFSVVYPNEGDVGRYRLLASWLAVPLLGAATPQSRGTPLLLGGLLLFLIAGAGHALIAGTGFFAHSPTEGGRWVIDAVADETPSGSVIVTGWLDATSLAYAYVDGSLPRRIIVSDDKLRTALYRRWATTRPVFVLVDPHDVARLPGAQDYAALDAYHELFKVTPHPLPK